MSWCVEIAPDWARMMASSPGVRDCLGCTFPRLPPPSAHASLRGAADNTSAITDNTTRSGRPGDQLDVTLRVALDPDCDY